MTAPFCIQKETSMTTPELPNISEMDSEQLLALHQSVDARLEEIRSELMAQAERLGLAVNGAKTKRRGRKPKREQEADDDQS